MLRMKSEPFGAQENLLGFWPAERGPGCESSCWRDALQPLLVSTSCSATFERPMIARLPSSWRSNYL